MAEQTVVFISGVSQGIGKEMFQIFLSRPNHTVIGSVRNSSNPVIAELKASKAGEGSKPIVVFIESNNCEVDTKTAFADIEAAGVDHIDIVFANAGGSPPVIPIDVVPVQDLMDSFKTNAVAPLVLFQTLTPLMKKSKNPKFASITSITASITLMGPMGTHMTPSYGAGKAAQNWLTHALHHTQTWAVVCSFHPGLVQTGPGNWVARHIGMEEAPITVNGSASTLIKTLEEATREKFSGHYVNVTEGGSDIPW